LRREQGRAETPSPLAWCLVAALLGFGALAVHGADRATTLAIDWQPALAFSQPWRAWTAAWVHYSERHLLANLAGCALVAALGWAARVPRRAAFAWLVAWPATQLGLLSQPALLHYGGLSGVLHAGVAIAALHLSSVRGEASSRQRRLGLAILAGLAAKLVFEAPWRGALAHPPGWDIATAPGAHVSGVVAGLMAAVLLLPWRQRPDSAFPSS
jgi:rhomboid family GlyGly-CTERM serine protease